MIERSGIFAYPECFTVVLETRAAPGERILRPQLVEGGVDRAFVHRAGGLLLASYGQALEACGEHTAIPAGSSVTRRTVGGCSVWIPSRGAA